MAGRGGTVSLEFVVNIVDRFGADIEADFHKVYGLDLLDFFRGRYSWRKFRVLLDRLPAASHYSEAVAGDEQIARHRLDSEAGPRRPARPRISEFDPVVAELAVVADRVGQVLVALSGGRAKLEPRPRPLTAREMLEEQRRVARYRAIESEVLEAQARARAANTGKKGA